MEVKFLILGAGPAGLTFANQLQESREKSFLVLEKEKWGGKRTGKTGEKAGTA